MLTRSRPLATRTRRLLSVVALVAQVLAVLAPLVDIHPANAVAVVASGSQLAADPGLPGQAPHDASRCPGCIAQLSHAVPTLLVRVGAPGQESQFTIEAPDAGDHPSQVVSALHSRAPPSAA